MSGRTDDDAGVGQSAEQEAQPTHTPFSWLHTETLNRGAGFIESVADICAGLQTCLQLVHSSNLALHARLMGDDEAMPVLGTVDRERLLRLAIAVTGALADGAHQEIEWVNEQARKSAERGQV
jgi:hypothetical protein